ncbi:response regulator [Xylanibacillus composti]|uniref:Response regulator n=1 Tax=Xylanibacillus composti TaxID=1572762 RepID=A0A8J4H7H5_9BACL|nr:response regulator [Xylanibacillus composti]MDT9725715.1 response regulator [Xylanibacillus composti]GIQ71146.1 hypothetical protein XYCOK13_39700 [Xylanibacillus composti]
MKIVLLDDEALALKYMEHQLRQIAEIEDIKKFTDPQEFRAYMREAKEEPGLVFLDIHLPEVNGVELAEQLLEHRPGLNIVFVTAYDDYAIKAFELNALDYIMKPVSTERLTKTLERIQERMQEVRPDVLPSGQSIRMQLFQQVLIESGSGQWSPLRWRTTRAQELFLYLLQHRGQPVRKSVLVELMWPDYEPNRAYAQLYTAIYHIRKTLEPYGDAFTIVNATDSYILHVEHVRLDVEEWEQFVLQEQSVTTATIETYEETMALYKGDYLQEYEYWWAESERHRLKLLWIRTSIRMAEWYVDNSQKEKAVVLYLDICHRHPLAEEAHFALMKLYAAANNHLSVHRQYRWLTTILQEELGEEPSPYITEWYTQWRQDNEA